MSEHLIENYLWFHQIGIKIARLTKKYPLSFWKNQKKKSVHIDVVWTMLHINVYVIHMNCNIQHIRGLQKCTMPTYESGSPRSWLLHRCDLMDTITGAPDDKHL